MMRTLGSRKLEDRKTIHAHPYTSHMVAELGCSSASVGSETSTDLKGFDMGTVVRQLAEQEHSAALAQLRSRISPITKSGANDGNDPFVKVQDLITDLIRLQTEVSPETNQKSYCDEETSKATEKEDRDLLSVAYKNAVDSRRAAWRVITSVEQKEKSQGEEQLASYAREYIAKVENELHKIREGVLALMDKKLVPSPCTDESKAFYYKMKSDYYRYLAEFATGKTRSKAGEDTCVACAEATKIAENDLALSSVVAQRQNHIAQTVQKTMETSQLQCIDKVSDGLVVQVEHVPQSQVAEETIEILQLDAVEKIVETTEIQDRIQQRTVEQIVDTPVPRDVEEPAEFFKAFSQNRVQQHSRGQIIETPVVSLAEKIVEVPVIQAQGKTQQAMNTHVQHVVNAVEAEMPRIIKETVQRKKPILNEKINQVTKRTEIPQLQFLNEVADMPVVVEQQVSMVQMAMEAPQVRVVAKTVENPQLQKTVEAAKHIQQERVKELRSKFEVGHTSEVPRPIRSVQKTVEVPRVQYIDKVADMPVDMQRQVSTTQAAQDIEEVEDVPALTQSEVPNIPDDDEDWLVQESKKRKLPMPADAVSESRADESDFDRFEDLVLPSPEGKTVFISIASGDEAEDEPDKQQEITRSLVQGGESMLVDETDAQAPERELVQAVHDVASDMSDVKNEIAHVREMVGVLVRRERSAEHKAEAATRRLDRMEREQTEADDAEHEANLQEALANQSKAVKVLVDKWFVDKGYGFGKAPTGEIVFIHASAVQGAEVLTIGTDAWVQVVNDDARAQGGYRAKRAWGRNAWKAERDKENANKVAQQVRRAAALTAELAAQSEKKTAAVCDQPPGLDELAGHIEAPNMGAGGSHPQATMMPDPWATYKCPSAEEGQPANNAPPETTRRAPTNKCTFDLTKGFRDARSRSATRNVETRSMVDEVLDFYEKANGRDRTQKRQELENMRPGELRRSLERWQARAKEVQRLQEKKEHAWDLYSRVPSFGRKKEDFERDFAHKVVYNGKVDEKSLQEWTDEMQSKVQRAEREFEARERRWMKTEDCTSQRRRTLEKLCEPGAFSSLSYFSSLQRWQHDVCCCSSVSERHESLARADQTRIYGISPFASIRDMKRCALWIRSVFKHSQVRKIDSDWPHDRVRQEVDGWTSATVD